MPQLKVSPKELIVIERSSISNRTWPTMSGEIEYVESGMLSTTLLEHKIVI